MSHDRQPSIERARLRWRARRGLLENDIILTRFLDAYEHDLSDDAVLALEILLELTDGDLMDYLLSRKPLPSDLSSNNHVVQLLAQLQAV